MLWCGVNATKRLCKCLMGRSHISRLGRVFKGESKRERYRVAMLEKWRKPENGEFTCNVDALVFKNRGVSTFESIIIDQFGSFVAAIGGRGGQTAVWW
ncbi:hypothetical protein Scep_006571 [Stephania cephalantha]|uniref:Uncharacterized protein n=1 Tax=Stephania cephalantha TaxID=152367 RepID=A0AAP0KA54_9MAGN